MQNGGLCRSLFYKGRSSGCDFQLVNWQTFLNTGYLLLWSTWCVCFPKTCRDDPRWTSILRIQLAEGISGGRDQCFLISQCLPSSGNHILRTSWFWAAIFWILFVDQWCLHIILYSKGKSPLCLVLVTAKPWPWNIPILWRHPSCHIVHRFQQEAPTPGHTWMAHQSPARPALFQRQCFLWAFDLTKETLWTPCNLTHIKCLKKTLGCWSQQCLMITGVLNHMPTSRPGQTSQVASDTPTQSRGGKITSLTPGTPPSHMWLGARDLRTVTAGRNNWDPQHGFVLVPLCVPVDHGVAI